MSGPNPSGMCLCGCGTAVRRAAITNTKKGHVKGEFVRFAPGHRTPADSRFRIDPDTLCWNWLGSKNRGYAVIDRRRAARVYYERHRGEIPEGYQIDHLCRNPACVNPDHLEPVTPTENVRRSSSTKLTWEQVVEIRRSPESGAEMARRFGVTPSSISMIRSGRTWNVETLARVMGPEHSVHVTGERGEWVA